MKIKYLVLALLPLSLMACQTVQNVTDNVISQINTNAAKNLTEYTWTYQGSKASKPLVLAFNDSQRLSIQTGCNNQGGTWNVEGNMIVTSPLMSTKNVYLLIFSVIKKFRSRSVPKMIKRS